MDMPGYLDYGKMMEMNPMAYQQASDQLSLAKQFQAEKQKQAEAKSLADMMANDQSKQMNPMLLEAQGQINQGRGVTNQSSALDFERKQATHVQDLSADQRAAARKLTEDDFKEADQHIEKMLRSGDQQQIQQAIKAQQYLPALLAEKRKHEAEMEKERYKEMQATGRSLENNATSRYVADRGAEARIASAGSRGGPVSVTNTLVKLDPVKRLGTVQAILATGINPDTQQPLSEIERSYFTNMYEQDTLALDARTGAALAGKLDMGAATGMKTNPIPSVRMPTDVAPRGSSPVAAVKTQDDLAREWLAKNPNDPRAAEIKKKLGVN